MRAECLVSMLCACVGSACKQLPGQAECGCTLQKDAGSWLWISMDDTVLNAVKKARLQAKAVLCQVPSAQWGPRAAASGLCAAQMTKAHVGSLLVFDPSKMELTPDGEKPDMEMTKREAVVGIVTERGACLSCLPLLVSSAPPYGQAQSAWLQT